MVKVLYSNKVLDKVLKFYIDSNLTDHIKINIKQIQVVHTMSVGRYEYVKNVQYSNINCELLYTAK